MLNRLKNVELQRHVLTTAHGIHDILTYIRFARCPCIPLGFEEPQGLVYVSLPDYFFVLLSFSFGNHSNLLLVRSRVCFIFVL